MIKYMQTSTFISYYTCTTKNKHVKLELHKDEENYYGKD